MNPIEDYLFLTAVCVLLPVIIVWMKTLYKRNETNKRAEVLLAAIEKNADIDTQTLARMMTEDKKPVSIKSGLLKKMTKGLVCSFVGIVLIVMYYVLNSVMGFLMGGAITLAIGLAYMLSYLIGMKTLAREIEAEEKRSAGSATVSQTE